MGRSDPYRTMNITHSDLNKGVTPERVIYLKDKLENEFSPNKVAIPLDILKDIIQLSNSYIADSTTTDSINSRSDHSPLISPHSPKRESRKRRQHSPQNCSSRSYDVPLSLFLGFALPGSSNKTSNDHIRPNSQSNQSINQNTTTVDNQNEDALFEHDSIQKEDSEPQQTLIEDSDDSDDLTEKEKTPDSDGFTDALEQIYQDFVKTIHC